MPPYTAVEFVKQRHEMLELGVGDRKQSVRTLVVTYRVLDWEESLNRFERAGQPLKSCLIMCETDTLDVHVHSITKGSVRVAFSVEAGASPAAQVAARVAANAVEVGGESPKRMEEIAIDAGWKRRRRHWSWWDTNYADFPEEAGACRHLHMVPWSAKDLRDMREGKREKHRCSMCNGTRQVAMRCSACPADGTGFDLCKACYSRPLVPAPKGGGDRTGKAPAQKASYEDEEPNMKTQTYGAAFSSSAFKQPPPGWDELPDGTELPDGPQRR